VHLGSFEGEMVTYRAKAGDPKNGLFTEVGGQLEAYCSGIGKVLLAHLPDEELAAYLANGPFYALTVNTITDAGALSAELKRVRAEGMAFDREEVEDGLNCVAVPLFVPDGSVPLALSASFRGAIANARILSQAAARLLAAKASIEALFATP
jgi:DNA-binding IclR family transcriptional regulator